MTTWAKKLGYGGAGWIDAFQVLITSGSLDQADSPSTLEMLDIPSITSGAQTRSRVKHAPGTSQHTGSISFDVNKDTMSNILLISTMLNRNYQFNVEINDGEEGWTMTDCLVQSLSLSGSPGGLIAASLSFAAVAGRTVSSTSPGYVLDYSLNTDTQPLAYWWSGADDVREWTFTFNQDVAPMYGNVVSTDPTYLRAGLVTYSLQTTTYSPLAHSRIDIMTSSFILSGFSTAEGYTYNGPNDLGMYSYTFETAAVTTSDNTIIT